MSFDKTREVCDSTKLVKKPLVSVLMLTFNHASYIGQAIESVLSQETSFQFELLIGEDCSSDSSREIALSYQNRHPQTIRVITADSNVGIYKNFRRLLTAARGEYFAYLDGDDYWLPGKLEQQVAYLGENADCVAVYTNAITVDESGKKVGLFNDVGLEKFDLAAMVRRGNFLNTSSMVVRSGMRESLLAIDSLFIDYRMHLRFARAGALVQLKEPLTAYRISSSGSMLASASEVVRRCYWQALLDVPRPPITDDDFAHGLADFLRRVAFRAIRTRRPRLLLEWWHCVIHASPYRACAMAWMTLESMLRQAFLALRGVFARGRDGGRISVLYRR
ncbi:glycosyltransferase involved in cell wall biosynthesis [Lysobacter niabensis]|uniref:Glycosyltransferase involved in cell wall biosynthesis n=1 Tax=Agrilutibacter niabensis TaxID=380628 RepID=A0ABU1VJX0_9GAMM|nr:glycosyltransferase [Lysobacter niabensis]MDR7097744.1 glycosyltransferase involved in cell wall biosynthesis [Lysobacter niabensis]